MKDPYAVVKHPLVTEKTTMLGALNQYVFEVDSRANKVEIAKAISQIYKVEVDQVRTLIVKPEQRPFGSRAKKRQLRKKAMVTLKPGSKIDLAM